MVENYHLIPMLDFDATAAAEFQRLARSRLRVGTMDLKIAAIVLAHDATLITSNLIDFVESPDYESKRVEDWTV